MLMFSYIFSPMWFLLCNSVGIYRAFTAVLCEHLQVSLELYPRDFLWNNEERYDFFKVVWEIYVQPWKQVLLSDPRLVPAAVKYLSVPQCVSFLLDILLLGS